MKRDNFVQRLIKRLVCRLMGYGHMNEMKSEFHEYSETRKDWERHEKGERK